MTQEHKDILLKDLCARLPYGVKCKSQQAQDVKIGGELLIDINIFGRVNIGGHIKYICDIKPYLFPLSNMREEDFKSLFSTIYNDVNIEIEVSSAEYDGYYEIVVVCSDYSTYYYSSNLLKEIDYIGYEWLNAHHFDYRGLIPLGLAIDATGRNIY